MKRIVVAGILGGLVVFVWGWLSHAVLPLGTVGIKNLPNEDAVTGTSQRASAPGPVRPGASAPERPEMAEGFRKSL